MYFDVKSSRDQSGAQTLLSIGTSDENRSTWLAVVVIGNSIVRYWWKSLATKKKLV